MIKGKYDSYVTKFTSPLYKIAKDDSLMTQANAPELITPRREPRLEIEYCQQCRWLPRATWLAQELLTTFSAELAEVALIPGSGGVFNIRLNNESIFCRKEAGRFPEPKELKQKIRDRIAPGKPLGHSDTDIP